MDFPQSFHFFLQIRLFTAPRWQCCHRLPWGRHKRLKQKAAGSWRGSSEQAPIMVTMGANLQNSRVANEQILMIFENHTKKDFLDPLK